MYNHSVELRHLRYFVAVAQELHFGRAAEKLHIAQPPLSQQIRQLEHIVGVRLFERKHHLVTLTSEGKVFLEDASRILEQVDSALLRMQNAQNGQIGQLNIGFVNTAIAADNIIADVLAAYHPHFPAVEICLQEMYLQEQLQALEKHQIQVGFAARFYNTPEDFNTEVIQRIPFVAVCALQHRFASMPSVALSSLVKEPFIFCPRRTDSGALYDHITQLCGFSPHVTQEVPSIDIVLGLVAANLGVSLVPTSATSIRTQGVVYLPLKDMEDDIAFETILIWLRNNQSPLLREFLSVAQEVMRQQRRPLLSTAFNPHM